MDTVKTCYAFLDTSTDHIESTELRGYLGYLFVNEPEFHHHSENAFHYPLVQYKKIKNKLLVMGLNDYARVVFDKMAQLESIVTPQNKVSVLHVDLSINKFKIREGYAVYRFVTPWLSLNEENYKKFKVISKNQRRLFLEKILVGNFLSALKGLGIFVDFKIQTNISYYCPILAKAHDNKFLGFKVEFATNVSVPDYLGLGKSVSKGFGVISRLN